MKVSGITVLTFCEITLQNTHSVCSPLKNATTFFLIKIPILIYIKYYITAIFAFKIFIEQRESFRVRSDGVIV